MNTPRLEEKLRYAWPSESWADVSVLVAVSGGADSVALLRGLAALKHGGTGRLLVAHFNHRLRGEESEADEDFVSSLAKELHLEFECGRLEVGGIEACPDGVEEAARSQRYLFLTNAAERLGARYVACAHTADDQIETILQRMVRGTGIAGLAGIPRSRLLSPPVTLIRPLLEVRRAELVDYLALLGQPYREDSSNLDRRFTRNRIRHDLLPHLAEHYNPAVGEALRRLGRLAGESQSVIRGLVRAMMDDNTVRAVGDATLVRRDKIQGQPEYLVRELLMAVWQTRGWPLQSMGFEEWDSLVQMMWSRPGPEGVPSGKRTFPGQIEAENQSEGLLLRPR